MAFTTYPFQLSNFYHIPRHETESSPPTPEPTTLALLGTGLIGMVLYGRKKKMLTN